MKKLVIRYLIIAMTTAVPVALWAPPVEACSSCPSSCPPPCSNAPGVDSVPGIGTTFLDRFFVPGGGSYGEGPLTGTGPAGRFNTTTGGGGSDSSNTLWGDYFLGGTSGFGQGDGLVSVEPGPDGQFAPGEYTFYGRYGAGTDSREPLATIFGTRPSVVTTPPVPVDPETIPRVRARRDGEILDVFVEIPKTGARVRFNSWNRAKAMMAALKRGLSWADAKREGNDAPRFAQDERANDSTPDTTELNQSMAEFRQEIAARQADETNVPPAGTDAMDSAIDSAAIEIQDTPPTPAGPPRPAGFTPSTHTITLPDGRQIEVQDGINLNGSRVTADHGTRFNRLGEIRIIETADGKIYGVDSKGNNLGPMHESRNQPFPNEKQYSFDDGYPVLPAPANQSAGAADDQASVPVFQDGFASGVTEAWDSNL